MRLQAGIYHPQHGFDRLVEIQPHQVTEAMLGMRHAIHHRPDLKGWTPVILWPFEVEAFLDRFAVVEEAPRRINR